MTLKPRFMMLVGFPGAGKSTFAKVNKSAYTTIISSDDIREERYGDATCQKDCKGVFDIARDLSVKELREGQNVFYDATNLSAKYRRETLEYISGKVDCKKVCLIIAKPFEKCLYDNRRRKHSVPDDDMQRMYRHFQPPWYTEGWDEIGIVYTDNDEKMCTSYFYGYDVEDFDQHSKYHSLTLKQHMRKTWELVSKESGGDNLLEYAALIHDIGKVKTKSKVNDKGELDGNWHYYNHHAVGAYDALFYGNNDLYPTKEVLKISNLVYFHMHLYNCNNEKSREKLMKKTGNLFDMLEILYEADVKAH